MPCLPQEFPPHCDRLHSRVGLGDFSLTNGSTTLGFELTEASVAVGFGMVFQAVVFAV